MNTPNVQGALEFLAMLARMMFPQDWGILIVAIKPRDETESAKYYTTTNMCKHGIADLLETMSAKNREDLDDGPVSENLVERIM